MAPGLRSPQRTATARASLKKHGEPSAQLGWAAAPVPEAGVPQVREPTAPSVTERQPAWHGRMRLQEAPAVAPAPPQFWGGGGPRPSSLPTHTLRRRLGAAGLPVHSCVRRWVPGRPLCMGGPGMDRISHTKWATQIGPVAQCMQSLFTPTLCSTPFVPPLCPAPPFSFRCCPVLCLPRPPSFLFSVAVPTPQYTPQYAPAMPRASPRPPPRPPTRHSPGLPPPRPLPGPLTGTLPPPGLSPGL